MKTRIDINCDMGEGFGQWTLGDAPDEKIMSIASSANIAAGFHAGDPNSMDRVASLCQKHGVGFGAHPGFNDLQGFGRRFIQASDKELINDIAYQIGAIREFGRKYNLPLQHVKLHGALYMLAASSSDLSHSFIDLLSVIVPDGVVLCMAGSETEKAAKQANYSVAREFYADRDYDNSGSIVFKRSVKKPNPKAIALKCLRACTEGKVETVEGDLIDIPFETICFHSDTPGALEIGEAIRDILTENGIEITSVVNLI